MSLFHWSKARGSQNDDDDLFQSGRPAGFSRTPQSISRLEVAVKQHRDLFSYLFPFSKHIFHFCQRRTREKV